ncbi:HipA family kinase [Bacillus sp. MUM 116]|uniref:HipA family kinase n=1 Tax=Bacillus sp. MUM 116 TaxID=1678002 RepID=UPI0015A6B384|nr:HipA family kinase [Bacillus sp. MUM 116]
MNRIYPVHYYGRFQEGFSKPQLFKMSNGKDYLVKFKNNPQGTRVLVNDWVVGQLAQLLELPVVPFELIYFSTSDFKKFPKLYQYGFKPGHQFASHFLKDCTGLWEPLSNKTIVNIDSLPGMIVFDYWVNNNDRDTGNVLLEKLSDNTCYLHLIDHGLCFPGHGNQKEKLQYVPMNLLNQSAHTWSVTKIEDPDSLKQFTEKVLSLPSEQILSIINSIPDDWDMSSSEKKALFKYLTSAKKALPILIVEFIKEYFSDV